MEQVKTGNTTRALQVCAACKARKRGCDKKLPSCSYCNRRALVCEYPSTVAPKRISANNIRKMYLPVMVPPRPTPDIRRGLCPSIRSSLLLMDTVIDWLPSQSMPADHLLELQTVDDLLYRQVYRIIQTTGLFLDDISVRFFRSIHRWIPIISRSRFQDSLVRSSGAWPADLSILLSSMCLMVYQGSPDPSAPDVEALYLTIKMLFAHAQALSPVSTNMIKASILISFFEYARHQVDTAFVSLGLCARLAFAAGLDVSEGNSQAGDISKQEEGRNIWWAIVILERLFVCETNVPGKRLTIKFPSMECPLPSEAEDLDRYSGTSPPSLSDSINNIGSMVGCFCRDVQASFYFDQVWTIVERKDAVDMETYTAISQIDRNLWSFLSIIMDQCDGVHGVSCGAIAITLRALDTLHGFLLNSSSAARYRLTSQAAIDSIVKITVDIADSHNSVFADINVDSVPPSCGYIGRAALRNLKSPSTWGTDSKARALRTLWKSIDFFDTRWCVAIQP